MRWMDQWGLRRRCAACIVMAACSVLAACTLGTSGDLGRAEFLYECYSSGGFSSDPYCDYDFEFGTGSTCGSACREAPWDISEGIPGPIALGAEFRVQHWSLSSGTLYSASQEMLAEDGQGYVAREEGRVALLSKNASGLVYDFTHLRILAPTRVRVDRVSPDVPTVRDIPSLDLATGEVGWVRALPLHGHSVLYGALPCQWTEDSTAIRITSSASDNLIEVSGDASGMGTLHLTLGSREVSLPVRVVSDASPLDGGAP